MAYEFYLQLVGRKTGQIKGASTRKGYEGWIPGLHMSHSIVSPRDAQSGLPTGQRLHRPFTFIKAWDASSALLLNMLCTNEEVSKCTIDFVHTVMVPGGASLQPYFTIQLTDANFASYDAFTANADQLNLYDAEDLEEWSLTYQSIDWSVPSGISATDDRVRMSPATLGS